MCFGFTCLCIPVSILKHLLVGFFCFVLFYTVIMLGLLQNAKHFSGGSVPIYFLTSNGKQWLLLCINAITGNVSSCSYNFVFLWRYGHAIVFLRCLFMMSNDIEQMFICLEANFICFGWNTISYSNIFSHSKTLFCFLTVSLDAVNLITLFIC